MELPTFPLIRELKINFKIKLSNLSNTVFLVSYKFFVLTANRVKARRDSPLKRTDLVFVDVHLTLDQELLV